MSAPARSVPLLEIRGLRVSFATDAGPVPAVRGVDLALAAGETLALVGESGCGKSVTALSILRLVATPPGSFDAGEILLEGENLLAASEPRMREIRGNDVAMIFQEPMTSLNPVLRVGEQVAEAIELHQDVSHAVARARAIEAFARVGIPAPEQRVDEYPHQLSGGLRQRVMIAMALACNPKLLIADEPTTALDVTIQAQILRLLAQLQRELGIAMVLITHDLGVVARIADRVAVMYAGQIVEHGLAREIFATPHHPYTRGLLDCIPVPGRTPPGGRLGTIPGVVPSLVGELAGCAFRHRCEFAQPVCAQDVPVLGSSAGQHWRCILETLPPP